MARLPDGKLEFLGRRDSQVKISGFRIESRDRESASKTVGVREARWWWPTAPTRKASDRFLLRRSSPNPASAGQLAKELPRYMVPSRSIGETLPLTEKGSSTVRHPALAENSMSRAAPRSRAPRPERRWRPRGRRCSDPQGPDRPAGTTFSSWRHVAVALRLAIALDRAVSLRTSTITRFSPNWPLG